jgi:hypothetical protein
MLTLVMVRAVGSPGGFSSPPQPSLLSGPAGGSENDAAKAAGIIMFRAEWAGGGCSRCASLDQGLGLGEAREGLD